MTFLLLYLAVAFVCLVEVVREYDERRKRMPSVRMWRTAITISLCWLPALLYLLYWGVRAMVRQHWPSKEARE